MIQKQSFLSLFLLMWVAVIGWSQTTLTGVVTDAASGEPLIAANVFIKGTDVGAITDLQGRYTIDVPASATTIIVSYTGYATQEIAIEGRTEINVLLREGIDVDELVVVGYGTQKKSNVTGSIAQVKGEDLEDMQVNRVEQALQGRASGVRITQGSGAPGAGSVIRIRGTSSINGSDPLVVVDGVVIQGGIDFLNPNDIASIEVLKDAASAAIYGARGANGVILVTTKGGQKGKMRINYNGFYGVQNPWKKLPMLNAREYAIIQNEMAGAAGAPLPFPNPDQYGEGTDWQDQVFSYNAPIRSNELNISGGTERMTYYSSVNYFEQTGIVAPGKSDYSRLTARLNTESQVNDRVKFGMNIAYTHVESRGVADNTEFGSPIGRALNIDPITPVYEIDQDKLEQAPYSVNGQLRPDLMRGEGGIYAISPYVTSEIVNPLAALATINNVGWSDKFVPNAFGEVKIIEGLKVRSSFGGDLAFYGGSGFTPAYYLNATNILDTNSVSRNINQSFTWIWDNTIMYDFDIKSDHQFSVLAGHSAQATEGMYLGGSKRDVPGQDPQDATIDYARNETSEQVFGGRWERYAIESYFSRMTYSYKGKYNVTAIMRADASSRFGPNYRWGYFPSISAGWNVNDEDFWVKNDLINALKVRAGWGRNGNDAANTLEFVSTIAGNQSYTFGGSQQNIVNGTVPAQIANPDLRWETVEQISVGTDVNFLKDFRFTADFFIQNTFDMKTQPPLPAYVGNNPPTANVGSMRNTGVDLELAYSGNVRGVNLSIGGNLSYIKNEVVNIGNEAGFVSGQRWGTQGIEITRITEGLPIGHYYGYVVDGVFQNEGEVSSHVGADGQPMQPNAVAGDFRFVDVNGDGVIDENDRTMIGDPTPTWTYGFTINADYKGFDLVIFGQGVAGNELYNATRRYDLPSANMRADALGRWTGPGTSNTFPRLTNADTNINFARSSSFYVESGAFFRIKTAQIGYTVPKRIAEYAGIGKARVYVASNNLLTFTQYQGFDPEIGSGVDRGIYPQARMYSVGLNVTFE